LYDYVSSLETHSTYCFLLATSSGGFASTGPHPDTKPDAKELNISGSTESGQDLGLVGSGEPEGVDVRGEDAYGAAGARIPPAVELNNAPENTSIRHSGQIVTGEERVPYGRGNSLETRAEAEERLGGVYDAERGNA